MCCRLAIKLEHLFVLGRVGEQKTDKPCVRNVRYNRGRGIINRNAIVILGICLRRQNVDAQLIIRGQRSKRVVVFQLDENQVKSKWDLLCRETSDLNSPRLRVVNDVT